MIRWGLLWLGASGVFAFGWIVGVALHHRGCEEAHLVVRGRALIAEANTDHALCHKAFENMNEYIDELEARIVDQKAQLDAYAAASELGDEIDQHLRERGRP